MDGLITVECPHCSLLIEVERKEINCGIFRHGIYKSNLKQIDPHASRYVCDELVKANLIFGCGKPFRLSRDPITGIYKAEICDYI